MFWEKEIIRERENDAPIREEKKASFFRRSEMVKVGGVRIKVMKSQPEIIVPRASRLRALTRFLFSSLVGESGEKEGGFKKQKAIIRTEYTEVSRVAMNASLIPINFDSLVKLSSRIRSFE